MIFIFENITRVVMQNYLHLNLAGQSINKNNKNFMTILSQITTTTIIIKLVNLNIKKKLFVEYKIVNM